MNLTNNDITLLKALWAEDRKQKGTMLLREGLGKAVGMDEGDAQHSAVILSQAGLVDGTFGGISLNSRGEQYLRVMQQQEDQSTAEKILQWIYAKGNGSVIAHIEASPYAEECGLTGNKKINIFRWLDQSGYIQFHTLSNESCVVQLKEKGRFEVERMMPKPSPRTGASYTVANSPGASIQIAHDNAATVNQTVGVSVAQIAALISSIKVSIGEFDEDSRADANEAFGHIEEEVKSGRKDASKMKLLAKGFLAYLPKTPELIAATAKIVHDIGEICRNWGVADAEIHKLIHHGG